jgi:hypothetical protein
MDNHFTAFSFYFFGGRSVVVHGIINNYCLVASSGNGEGSERLGKLNSGTPLTPSLGAWRARS